LHLVAAPRLLRLLRREIGKATSQAVVGESDKDFVHRVNGDITQRLFPPR
jgi:protein required for attachment to host cells